MLPHYSPLKVAETFTILAGLYPGRIDLGIGRAPGTDPLTTFALQRDRRQAAPDDFPEQLAELLAYLDDDLPADHPFARLAASLPGRPELPAVWLLGSSPQSAIWAAQLGLPYAFADFINPGRQRDRGRLPGALHAVAAPAAGPGHGGRRVGAVRRQRRGGPAPRDQQPDDPDAAAPRTADPGAPARAGGRVPGAGGKARDGCAARAAAGSSARRARSAPGSSSSRASTALRR